MISVIGDFHIPERAEGIPKEFIPFLQKSEMILCTGDLTDPAVLAELKSYSEVTAVRGNMDYIDLPVELAFEAHKIKFGLFHGRGIHPRGNREKLALKALELGVQVLVSGHTHQLSVEKAGNVILLNPGSATGAESGEGMVPKPTFLTLEPAQKALNITAYTLDSGLVGRKQSLQI